MTAMRRPKVKIPDVQTADAEDAIAALKRGRQVYALERVLKKRRLRKKAKSVAEYRRVVAIDGLGTLDGRRALSVEFDDGRVRVFTYDATFWLAP